VNLRYYDHIHIYEDVISEKKTWQGCENYERLIPSYIQDNALQKCSTARLFLSVWLLPFHVKPSRKYGEKNWNRKKGGHGGSNLYGRCERSGKSYGSFVSVSLFLLL